MVNVRSVYTYTDVGVWYVVALTKTVYTPTSEGLLVDNREKRLLATSKFSHAGVTEAPSRVVVASKQELSIKGL